MQRTRDTSPLSSIASTTLSIIFSAGGAGVTAGVALPTPALADGNFGPLAVKRGWGGDKVPPHLKSLFNQMRSTAKIVATSHDLECKATKALALRYKAVRKFLKAPRSCTSAISRGRKLHTKFNNMLKHQNIWGSKQPYGPEKCYLNGKAVSGRGVNGASCSDGTIGAMNTDGSQHVVELKFGASFGTGKSGMPRAQQRKYAKHLPAGSEVYLIAIQ